MFVPGLVTGDIITGIGPAWTIMLGERFRSSEGDCVDFGLCSTCDMEGTGTPPRRDWGLRDERVGLGACASPERTRPGLLCFCASIGTGFINYPAAPPFWAMVTCLIFLGVCAGTFLVG